MIQTGQICRIVTMTNTARHWICSQLGARQYYAVPKGLHDQGVLRCLVTDLWLPPRHPLRLFYGSKLRQRYDPGLSGAIVVAWNWRGVLSEWMRRRHLIHYDRTIARNNWFTRNAGGVLSRIPVADNSSTVLFSYSYTAAPLFEIAKKRGWKTVLMQIDCGENKNLIAALPGGAVDWRPPPAGYWRSWRCELDLADHIVANSRWTLDNLVAQGVPARKVVVQPLSYVPPAEAKGLARVYPERFEAKRPLRVLFLGQILPRKGVGALLEAAAMLVNDPIEFWFVGRLQMNLTIEQNALPNVIWHGPSPRSKIHDWYRRADVFVFPTYSDGFGITQLEAQAWRLPVIASRFCGEVVRDRRNGLVLGEVSAQAIVAALRQCLAEPQALQQFSDCSVDLAEYGIDRMAARLTELVL